MSVAPIDSCKAPKLAQIIFFEIGGPATSLLFLIRVKAVYNNSRIVTIFFSFLWLCIVGLTLSTLLTVGISVGEYFLFFCTMRLSDSCSADHIPYTQRCVDDVPNATYATVTIIVTAAFDTLVFLAISYHMVAISIEGNTWSARARLFFTGDGLYHLSKSLLQSGQAYYLSTFILLCRIKSNTFGVSP
jgi:hypothetical protein